MESIFYLALILSGLAGFIIGAFAVHYNTVLAKLRKFEKAGKEK